MTEQPQQPQPTPAETATPPATPAQPPEPPPAAEGQDKPADADRPTETVEFWKQKAREQESRAKANADAAKKLKEIEDRDLSELERAKRDAAVASERLAEYERTTMRQRVALEKGLPPSLVDRLQGSTADEVAADADALMALLAPTPTAPRPDPSQGARNPSAQDKDDAEYEQFYPSTPR